MKEKLINNLSKEIYKNNVAVGWWPEDSCIMTKLQLISTEIAEATEGDRKDLMDDHLKSRKMAEVELADVLIRTLDLGGRMSMTYYKGKSKVSHEFLKIPIVPAQHWLLNTSLIKFGNCLLGDSNTWNASILYSGFIQTILYIAYINSYDLEGAVIEKLAYNKTRADHKLENREKKEGKSY